MQEIEDIYSQGWDVTFFRSRQTNEVWSGAREVTTEWQMSLDHRATKRRLYVRAKTLSELVAKARGCIATGADIRDYAQKDKYQKPIPMASKDGSYTPLFSF